MSECQAELGDIARIAGLIFLSLSCIGQPLWNLCECEDVGGKRTKGTVVRIF